MNLYKSIFDIKAEFYLILMTIIWGGTFIFIKLSVETLHPSFFLSIRFGLALVGSLIIWRRSLTKIPLDSIGMGIMVGVIMFLGYASQTLGLEYTTATKSGFITGAYVIFTPILEAIWNRKFPSNKLFIAVIFVMFGLFLISFGSGSIFDLNFSEPMNIGDLITLAGALFFALYIILIDKTTKIYNERGLYFGQLSTAFLLSGIYFCIQSFLMGAFLFPKSWEGIAIFGLVYTGIIATIIPLLIQTRYQKAVTPTRAGIIFSLEPVFASLFAFLVAGESLSFIGWLGCLFVLVGILISEIPFPKMKNQANNSVT